MDLLYDLCDPPAWTSDSRWRWVQGDRIALHNWYVLEIEKVDALAEPTLDRNQVGDILGLVSEFHSTLPFDEAEGNWLLGLYGAMFSNTDTTTSAIVSRIRQRQPEEIISSGLRRVIDGRDLLRRWWAWRRDTDEYAGQGALDLSRDALYTMIDTLSPDLKLRLPESYVALRGGQIVSR